MNPNKLRSLMVLHGETAKALSEAMGIAPQTFSAKLNARDGAEFTQSEIAFIKERYELSAQDVDDIFFNPVVS